MSEIVAYKLTHLAGNCGETFSPRHQYRLHADSQNQVKFKYQDFMVGTCPRCKSDVYGWIGVDYLQRPVKYTGINPEKASKWFDRFDTDLARPMNSRAHGTVRGSVYDQKSGKYRFHDAIPVE